MKGIKNILCMKTFKKLFFLFIILIPIIGCKNNSNNDEEITVTDMIGRDVSLNIDKIERIVCIGAGALRLYSYIGDMNLIVGAEDIDRNQDDTDYSLFGAGGFKDVSRPYYDINKDLLKNTLSVGLGGPRNQNPETEKIILANPDLIISEYEDEEKMNKLQNDTETPVITIRYGNNHNIFDERLYNTFTLLGKVLKKEDRALELINYLKDSEAELKNISQKSTNQKESFYIGCLGNWGTQDILSTSANFSLFNVSNIKNAISSLDISNGIIDIEKLISVNPDNIILDSLGISIFKNQKYETHKEAILNLDAIRNGKVYLQMPFNAYYTNVEVALMDAYYISSIAYSDMYNNFSIEDKSTEILQKFLGKNASYSLVKDMKESYGGYQKIDNLEEFLG